MKTIEEYKKEFLTLDIMKANLYAIVAIIPVLILYGVPFVLLWRHTFTKVALKSLIDSYNLGIWGNMSVILLVITIGIITHELIHGITWAMFTKNGFKSIKVGILWKILTPYCHCSEPLKVKHYIAGAIMPAIILGLFPLVYSLFTGNVLWLFFAFFFTMSTVGDLMIVNLVRKEDMNSFVLDHPSEVGFYVFRKE